MVAHGRSEDETPFRNTFPFNFTHQNLNRFTVRMPERVNTAARLEAARSKIAELLTTHVEWFCSLDGGDSRALRNSELDIVVAGSRLILTSWTEQGTRSWKI